MRKFKNIIAIALISSSLTGCSKWLDLKPADRLVEESVFNSPEGFLSALTGVYMDLQNSNSYGSTLGGEFLDVLGQQYSVKSTNKTLTQVINYQYTSEEARVRLENIWDRAYESILNCNKILENVDKSTGILGKQAQGIIKGETLALRAYLHFDILRLFGPIVKVNPENRSIPYVDQLSLSAGELLPANQALAKIISDLTKAEELLLENDPITTEGPMSSVIEGLDTESRFRTLRFNYYAVLALKARVYLYLGDKVNALQYAKMVIEDANRETFFPFVKHTDITGDSRNPDRVFSTEMLFGLYNTSRNNIFTRNYSPDGAADNLLIPRAGAIVELFTGDESDYRFNPIWKDSPYVANELYSMKYSAGLTPTLFRNNAMPLIRLSEMYLIAAETETNPQNAYTYLNILRNNRGLTDINDNLVSRIEREYKREFYSEGQVFFYYKRNNVTSIKSGITGNNIVMNSLKYVPELPESEKRFR